MSERGKEVGREGDITGGIFQNDLGFSSVSPLNWGSRLLRNQTFVGSKFKEILNQNLF